MSVYSVRERWQDRQGEYHDTFLPSDNSTRYFLVETTEASDDDAIIGASGMLPAFGSLHPNTTIMTARDWSITNKKEHPRFWDIEVKYSDEPLKPPQDPNPLNRAAVIRMKNVRYDKYIIFDRDNNPIVTSAGEFYEPTKVDSTRPQIEIEKNYAYNAVPSWVFTESDTVNSSDVTITQLGQTLSENDGKLSEIELSQIQSEFVGSVQILYRTVKFVIDIRPEGWDLVLADRGYMAIWNGDVGSDPWVSKQITGGSTYFMMVQQSNGSISRATTPQYLDGSGHRLPQNSPVSDIVYNTFHTYDQFDFNNLPFS